MSSVDSPDGTTSERFGWRTGASVVAVVLAVLVGMVILAQNSDQDPPRVKPPTKPTMTSLEFAVWGSAQEVAAFQSVVDGYNATSKDTKVAVTSWPTATQMLADIEAGTAEPDLYLLPRGDLAATIAAKRNVPLLSLLQEREIPIGDDFSRESVAAFSTGDDLQCMPYTASPMVMYVNTTLVDFEAMKEAGLSVPSAGHTKFSFAQFTAAAEWASRPETGARGVHIEPTLRGLAPFVYSGGGDLFNDDDQPTSLALGEGDAVGAIDKALEVLRNPLLTLSAKQLSQQSALDWFKQGKLGMIAGFRDLTPELRATTGLSFDVLPMPAIDDSRTIGDLNGICLGTFHPSRTDASANFLTYLLSDAAVTKLAETGYVQPTKLTISLGEGFQQPDQQPAHAKVFTDAVRWMVIPPLVEESAALQDLIGADVTALFTAPVLDPDLADLLKAIDEKSRSLLDPEFVPEESPSGEPSESASP